MAPTKTAKKKAPSKSKATQAKNKEHATSTTALQAAKKSLSKATQAKGKENAASTAALQAKKKKQLKKDSGLGMLYRGLNDSSTAMSRHLLSIPRIPHCFGQY
jgi:hypothetical protein